MCRAWSKTCPRKGPPYLEEQLQVGPYISMGLVAAGQIYVRGPWASGRQHLSRMGRPIDNCWSQDFLFVMVKVTN
jgi:hypothetical protein